MTDKAQAVRNYYQRQGAEAVVQNIIRNIQLDAVLSTNVDVRLLERLVQIIEASQEETSAAL